MPTAQFHYPGKPGVDDDGTFFERLRKAIVIGAASHILAWILDDDPSEWDTEEEIRDNLVPALLRRPLELLANIFHTKSDSTSTPVGSTILSQLLAPILAIDSIQTHLDDVDESIANLESVASASSTTPAYVADSQDMATAPRVNLAVPVVTVGQGGAGQTGTNNTATAAYTGSTLSGHTHLMNNHAHSTPDHTHGASVSWVMPTYTPDRIFGSSTAYVDYTPIVVDRAGKVKKLRWIVGADTAIFQVDAYYMALCVFNPSNGNIEKVWDSGNIKDGASNTSTLQEVELDMGINQQCTPGQALFIAHQQIAPGALQGARSFAAAPQAGIGRPSSLLFDACTYRSPTRLGSIPSSISQSSLTRINTRIPWAAISVDTSGT